MAFTRSSEKAADQHQDTEALLDAEEKAPSKIPVYTGYALLTILALLVSSPTAANAAAGATNSDPKNMTPDWFLNNLTTSEQFWTATDGVSSLGVNAIVFFDFGLQLSHTMNGITGKLSENLTEKLLFSTLLVFALCSATAAFGLGEDNFIYLKERLWLIPALSFALSTFVTRGAALDSIATRVRNLRNEDAKLQANVAYALKNIHPDQRANVIDTFDAAKETYFMGNKNPTYAGLAEAFFTNFNQLHDARSFRKITPTRNGLRLFGNCVDSVIAPVIAVPTGLTFAQKGANGLRDLVAMFSEKSVPLGYQIPFGFGSGSASAALYFRSLDYRNTLLDVLDRIRASNKKIPLGILATAIVLANIPASESGENMGQKIIDDNSSWIYPWFPHEQSNESSASTSMNKESWEAMIYIMLNQLGVFIINSKSCFEMLMTRPPRAPKEDIDLGTFIRKLANPVSTIIKDDDLRERMQRTLKIFNDLQNQHKNTSRAPLLKGVKGNIHYGSSSRSIGAHVDAERPEYHPPLTANSSNTGVDTTQMEGSRPKMGSRH